MDQQSLVHYARHHKITRDYQEISPISLISLPPETIAESQTPFSVLELIDALPEHHRSYEPKEQLVLTKEYRVLLCNALKLKNQETVAIKAFKSLYSRRSNLKLEEPLLLHREETTHCREPLSEINLPYEPIQVEEDEGLEWSSKSVAEAEKLWTSIQLEKLQTDLEAIEYMRSMIQRPKTDSALEFMEFKINSICNYITPPLSPCIRSSKFKFPDIVINLPPIDDTNDDFDLADWLTEEVLRDDDISDHGEMLPYIHIPKVTPSPPKRRYSPLHVEVPLTPPATSIYKRVKVSEIAKMMPNSPCVTKLRHEQNHDDLLPALESVLKPLATKFLMGLQQEQLQAQDELRIPVPLMDFTPQEVPSTRNVNILKDIRGHMGSFAGKKWEVSSITELTELNWKVWHGDVHELSLESSLKGSDDETEINMFLNDIDFEQAYKSSITEVSSNSNRDDEIEILDYMRHVPKSDLSSLMERRRHALKVRKNINFDPKGSSSISDQLSSFLRLQNQETRTNVVSSVPKIETSPSIVEGSPIIHTPSVDPSKLPRYQFIVSTTMLEHRVLYRAIRSIYRNAVFVERDFTQNDILLASHNVVGYPQSVVSASRESLEEADILASPTTGIIITSLQKVRHRPLPGVQDDINPLRARVSRLAERYEVLVVVVNIGNVTLSTTDNRAIASLRAFGQPLGTVRIISIQDAGQYLEMATWIVCLLERYSFPDTLYEDGKSVLVLFDKESLWELFLRKAGLNAFASQVVLHYLRGEQPTQGLVRLFALEDDRVRVMLTNILGRKTFARLGRILNFQWE